MTACIAAAMKAEASSGRFESVTLRSGGSSRGSKNLRTRKAAPNRMAMSAIAVPVSTVQLRSSVMEANTELLPQKAIGLIVQPTIEKDDEKRSNTQKSS